MSDRLTPDEVVAELVALAVVEHSHTPGVAIEVHVDGATVTVTDTGRGMQLASDPGDDISHAQRALTSPYPCEPSSPEIAWVLTDVVWGERGSLGPSLANAACPAFDFTSRRSGERWTQR